MIEIMGLIVLLAVSVVVFSGWFFLKRYCLAAVEYLSKHPRSDFLIHVFTGLGFGWLVGLWMPKTIALVLGSILLVVVIIIRYLIPTAKLPEHLKSSGMGRGLPIGISIAWLSYPWTPEIAALILGAISIVGAETMHYVYPNLIARRGGFNRKT
jgi:hypothetical protein